MSDKALVKAEVNLPAEVMADLQADLREEIRNEGFQLPKIKIAHQSQAFEMPGGDIVKSFKGVVLLRQHYNVCYLEEKGDEIVPPDCSSRDGVHGSTARTTYTNYKGDDVPVFGSCGDCWFNTFGSAGEGEKGKMCSNKQHLVIWPLGVDASIPLIMSVSMSSARAVDALRTSANGAGCPIHAAAGEFLLEKRSRGPQVWSELRINLIGTVKDGTISVDTYSTYNQFRQTFASALDDIPVIDETEIEGSV